MKRQTLPRIYAQGEKEQFAMKIKDANRSLEIKLDFLIVALPLCVIISTAAATYIANLSH